ncbi:MAG: ABC transporter permease [Bacteroidetes bacterium]|jgi:ABC-2 type transport system permease protein|nr:ABC transporter permease [Bacteroidota bacterium]
MRTIGFLLQKEFLQVFRNRAMLPILFVMPFVQLIVLAYAATFEITDTQVFLIDEDHSPTSRLVVEKLEASGYFTVAARSPSDAQAREAMLRREVGMILRVPAHFERDLRQTGRAPVQVILNAEDGYSAGVIQSYVSSILADVSREVQPLRPVRAPATRVAPRIEVRPVGWYNPELSYKAYMVPGILVILVTMIGALLSGMNIAKEKEQGTIEQLNVTPIRKYQFIVGKLLPFWIIGLVELAFGLGLAKLVFDIPMRGSLLVVFGSASVYLLVVLGIGLWVSTVTETQQQAMFIAWFILVLFILMSGLFTPLESMPAWAQQLALLNPIAYFIEIMRAVLVKGGGWQTVQGPLGALAGYAAVVLSLAVLQYRKVTA